MKKFLSISLLFLYLVSSVGITVSAHYCGGDLASFAFFEGPSFCCCDNESSEKADDCCKDESKSLKITADQNKVELSDKQFQIMAHYLSANTVFSFDYKSMMIKVSALPVFLPLPPDRANLIPAYKRNHSFLFYS